MGTKDPGLTINVHVKDETEFSSIRIPSSGRDFVAVNIGFPVTVMLFNAEQAQKLIDAVVDAYHILAGIELNENVAKMRVSSAGSIAIGGGDTTLTSTNCTVENPCYICTKAEY